MYDAFFTTKTYNVEELRALGCRRPLLIANTYDPATHRPVAVSPAEREAFGGEVGFIGAWEAERAQTLYYLATNGIRVRIWGGDWQRMGRRHERLVIGRRPLWARSTRRRSVPSTSAWASSTRRIEICRLAALLRFRLVRDSWLPSEPLSNRSCSRKARRWNFSGHRKSFCARSDIIWPIPRSGSGLRPPVVSAVCGAAIATRNN